MHPDFLYLLLSRGTVQRILRGVIVAGFAASTAIAAPLNTLPDLGDESAAVVSPAQEKQLGTAFMREARRILPINDDAEIASYVSTLGSQLARHTDPPRQDFHFFVVNDTTLNAFAVPGGYVAVHSGIIQAAQSEDELAAVLAHEISHITQRHIPRMIAQANREQLPTLAAVIAAILIASSGGHVDVGAVGTMAAAAQEQSQLSFGRAYEEEADRIGLGLMARAGYDPHAMAQMFERLLNWSRLNETSAPEFLRTHPLTTTRISEARDNAERYPAPPKRDSAAFLFMRAKAEVLAQSNAGTAVERTRAALGEGDENAEIRRYAYAVALARAHDFDAARKQVSLLMNSAPNNIHYQLLSGEIALNSGRATEALSIFQNAQRQDRRSDVAKRRYAEALLALGRNRAARDVFRELVAVHPDDAALKQLLSRAAGEAGFKVEAHQSLAEYYFSTGDNDAALVQLDIAKRAATTDYQRASIKARTREIQEQIALLKASR